MDNRTALTETALSLFHSRGYENTGIQKIVDEAQVSKPTLYYYFGNKRGLLEAVLSEGFQNFWPGLQEKTAYRHDLVHNLEEITRFYFQFSTENRVFYQWYLSVMQAPPESDPGELVVPVLEQQWHMLEQLFSAASDDHGNMRGRSRRFTFSFLGMINTYITTSYHEAVTLDDENAFQACRQFMHGIFS